MKNYIITGAGKGLGFEVTKKLIDNKNCYVFAISRNVNQIKKIKSNNLLPIQADINLNIENIISFIGKTKIDGILNNAGILIKKDFTKYNKSDFDKIFHTNVLAPLLLTTALLKNINKNAHVVNIGSMGGLEGSVKFPGLVLYSSSKAALHCLTQCLSVELDNRKIAVNCLSIGSVETAMLKQAFPGYKSPISAQNMAEFVSWFLVNGHNYFKGQILPVALTTP